jgi:hypothetical protein
MSHGMKRSTISTVISKKVNNWLKTITDLRVRQLAEENTIVSGGAIASMMLGEPVNDYDIYFRNYETALAVAHYYVGRFNRAVDLKTKVRSYEPVIKEMDRVNILGETEKRIIIWMQSAGVAGETTAEGEYEYFESQPAHKASEFLDGLHNDPAEDAASAAEELRPIACKMPYRAVFLSENAITLSDRVQLVVRFSGDPAEIHRNYDFVHAMGYYDHKTKEVVVTEEAMESLLSKTLVYKGSLYPIASLFRIRKFLARGWRIKAGEMLKIIWQLQGVNLSDPKVLREQLLGVDQAYMHQLIAAIGTAQKAGIKIDDTYLAKLIDTIFE